MPIQTQKSATVYQTITGGHIALSRLSEPEYALLDMVAKKYNAKQEWTRFAAWWNAKFNASGLPNTSVVYRICQDLEARLGINQGKVSCPDYRDYLAELIDAQFGSRLEFCRATGIDPGQLSRVLASRDNLSMKVLLRVLDVLNARLVIQSGEESLALTSIDKAAEAVVAALGVRNKQPESHLRSSSSTTNCATRVDEGATVAAIFEWTVSFPNVQDIEKVVAVAQSVAQCHLPLMIADAA
jgi:hypothetical protein